MVNRQILAKLNRGQLGFDEALDQFDGNDHDAYKLGRKLARMAPENQLRSVLDKAEGTSAAYIVGATTIERGAIDLVLEREWSVLHLIALAQDVAFRGESIPGLIARLAAALEQMLAGSTEELDELSVLGLKRCFDVLEEPLRSRLLAWLDPRLDAGFASGAYDELDYAYGQVGPLVELAQCHLGAGDTRRAEALLERREVVWPAVMNIEELIDLVFICTRLPAEVREGWRERLREWARKSDRAGISHEGVSFETEWLLRTGSATAGPSEELLERLSSADVQTLAVVLEVRLGGPARDLARGRLVDLLEEHVHTLETGGGKRARAIRAVRAVASSLDSVAVELSPEQHDRVGDAASRWADWLCGYDPSGDWLEHRYAAIAFAGAWRDRISPVVELFRAHVRAGDEALPTYERVERLLVD